MERAAIDEFYESDLCVPQRSEGACPATEHMGIAEKLQGLAYILLMFLGSSHLPFIGYAALLPMTAATLGLVGMMRAIRGVVICTNGFSGCFAMSYFIIAIVFIPPLKNVCLHLEYNRRECFRCPLGATLDKCPDAFQEDSHFGMNCYNTTVGTIKCSEYDDCRSLALARSPYGCYCTDAIFQDSWADVCSETQRKYVDMIIPMACVATAIFLLGAVSGCFWGCFSSDVFSGNVAETITERSIVSRGCDSSMRESFRKSTAEASDPILPILAVGTPSTVVQGVSLCQSMFHPTVTLHLLSQGDSGASSSRQHHRVNGAERSLAASSDDPAATHVRDIVLQLAPEPQYVPRSITLEVADDDFLVDDSGDDSDDGDSRLSIVPSSPRVPFENPVHPEES